MIHLSDTTAAPLLEPLSIIPVAPAPNQGAFEVKFPLTEAQVDPIIQWARANLPPDIHAEAFGGDTYHVNSLYLDTPEMDVYHGRKGYQNSKFRIRRYGVEPRVYLERKCKTRGWVTKQRCAVPDAEITLLNRTDRFTDWRGEWYRERIQALNLLPQCQVSYLRVARVGEADGAPIRLTLDRQLRCAPANTLSLPDLGSGARLEIDAPILELKFQSSMPRLFKLLVREFALQPKQASKYRRAAMLCIPGLM